MTDERKRLGAGFWTAIVVAAFVAYPVLLGPCCWASSRTERGISVVSTIYRPLIQTFAFYDDEGPGPILNWLQWWSELGAKDGWEWEAQYHFGDDDLSLEDELASHAHLQWNWTKVDTTSFGCFF